VLEFDVEANSVARIKVVGVGGADPGGAVVHRAVGHAGGEGVGHVQQERLGVAHRDGLLVLAQGVLEAEVLGGERGAQGEAEHRPVAALEHHLVDAGLLALDGDVHLGLVGDEVDPGLGGLDVEVAQLGDAGERVLEGVGAEHVPFLEEHGPAQDLVLGLGVALELDPADGVLLALVDLDVDVDLLDPVVLPHRQLPVGPEHDVAAVVVGLPDLVQALVQGGQVERPRLGARGTLDGGLQVEPAGQPGPVVPLLLGDLQPVELLALGALEDLVVALQLEPALVELLALQDREGEGGPQVVLRRLALEHAFLVLLLLARAGAVLHLDDGLADEHVLVALLPVLPADVVQVLFLVLLHHQVLGADPAPQAVDLGLLQGPAQVGIAEDLVALELDAVDPDPAALLDVEHQAGDVGTQGLQGDVHHRVGEPLLGRQVHQQVLDLAGHRRNPD